jgi:hypothetical protein
VAVHNLGFGTLLALCGRRQEALPHLQRGRDIAVGFGNLALEFAYRLCSACLAFASRDLEGARDLMAGALSLGEQHGYMYAPLLPRKIFAHLCLLALDAGAPRDYVCALIERNELSPDPTWRHAELWPWPLRIYTLGRFGLVRYGAPLQFSGKAQKKPLELLKALIAFGGRNVSETKLADALWPDAEGDAAAQSLATTLFRLRKLIGAQAIGRQDGRLTLSPAVCWLDCWAFERLVADEASGDPTRPAALTRLYQGPFLDGTDNQPWVEPMRLRLEEKFTRFLRAQKPLARLSS